MIKLEESKSDETSPKQFIKGTTGAVFVKENQGNIKDYYKISSCIGRGKSYTVSKQGISQYFQQLFAD